MVGATTQRLRRDKQGRSHIQGRSTEWPLPPGGGLKAGSSDEVGKEEGFDFAQRPNGWAQVEMRTICQRPLPLAQPRVPDMEYHNMTVNAAEYEGGPEMGSTSVCRDPYRRSEAQVEAVNEIRRDQRSFGGGVFECLNQNRKGFYLTIERQFAGKNLGIVLEQIKDTKRPCTVSRSFFEMEYEKIKLIDGERYRQGMPTETLTGFKWNGVGADYEVPSSTVYRVCERAGERDLHFSVKGCARITEAPGASQSICANQECGVVIWHFQRLKFEKDKTNSDDFSLVVFRNGTRKLCWRDQDGAQSMWSQTDSSSNYIRPNIFPAALERAKKTVKKYPQVFANVEFPEPSFVPALGEWRKQHPLKRKPKESRYKFLAALLLALQLTPGEDLLEHLSNGGSSK